jgi:hypothetical protein
MYNQNANQATGFSSSQLNQPKQINEFAPVNPSVQDLLARFGTINARLGRLSQLVRYSPEPSTDAPKPSPTDLTCALQMCHSALNYTESIIADLESSIGI